MIQYKSITAFAPATVANVSCGFDIMGFAINGIGDRVTVSLNENKYNSCVSLSGAYGHLIPNDFSKNTASVAVLKYLEKIEQPLTSLNISLEKNLPLGSGMGSSASSSAAAVFAANYLFGNPLSTKELIPFAMEGERIACGTAHADNVAPALLGGFTLIRSYNPLDIISIQQETNLYCIVIHPQIELNTSDSRKVLRQTISVEDAIKHSANTAGFMVGLLSNDYELMSRSMKDLIAEPKRSLLIPGFHEIKKEILSLGALGFGISGSGPSVFAFCSDKEKSELIAKKIQQEFSKNGLQSEAHISKFNAPGASITNQIKI